MQSVEPISTIELFPPLSRELISILKSLDREDWSKPTACAQWAVKDVTAHLLGGNLGRLSEREDEPVHVEKNELNFEELVRLIDEENEAWVKAARRINPSLLLELLEKTDDQLYTHFKSLPMEGPSRTPVSWAGETESLNWMDIAREYTEKWLHQQHIREAVGKPLLTGREWLYPVLDTFLRALPYTYRNVKAGDGMSLSVQVKGEAGGEWCLLRQEGRWQLYTGLAHDSTAMVEIGQDLAWRLFSTGVSPEQAQLQVQLLGDWNLGLRVLQMVSIMA